jgi:hypothetical protein
MAEASFINGYIFAWGGRIMNEEVFEVICGSIRITDPCYSISDDDWGAGTLSNVLNGTWVALPLVPQKGEHAGRCISLKAVHQNHLHDPFLNFSEEEVPFDVFSDSGQIGFFDLEGFKPVAALEEGEGTTEEHETFYEEVCTLTSRKECYGILPFGVVSSTAYGDGDYRCTYGMNDDGKIVAIAIDFVGDEEDEEAECDLED